jgi:peptidyl-tRNA hydrolase, PTH1 family
VYLVTGLGNPGTRYADNRHNAGFMLLDRLAAEARSCFTRSLKRSYTCRVESSDLQVVLAKPNTYMNLSGTAVAELLHHFPVSLDRLLIAYDDVALPLGKIRFRRGGSSGGHRGMQSVMDSIRSSDIPRLRIGIGGDQPPDDYPDFVLADFTRKEMEVLEEAFVRACEGVHSWVADGIEKTMSKFNS